MITAISKAGTVAASYPKTIAANTQWNTWNPTSGGRRTYSSTTTSYASPAFLDTPGWTWPAGGPLNCPGYQLQLQISADRLEGVGSGGQNHFLGLEIGGTGPVITMQTNATSNPVSPFTNAANSLAGAVKFHDYMNPSGGGGTAFTGNEVMRYQYVRS